MQCKHNERAPINKSLVYNKGQGTTKPISKTLYWISLWSQSPCTWIFQKSGSGPVTGDREASSIKQPTRKTNLQIIYRHNNQRIRPSRRLCEIHELHKRRKGRFHWPTNEHPTPSTRIQSNYRHPSYARRQHGFIQERECAQNGRRHLQTRYIRL